MTAAPAVETFVPELATDTPEAQAELSAGVRAYTRAVRDHLAELHAAGEGGETVNLANSDAYDRLIRRLYEMAESSYFAENRELGGRVAIAAVGGFARREMSVGSDVDLLFLFAGEMSPFAARVAERVQQALWDAGAKVGASVRSIEESLALAHDDVSARTAILTARFLAGDPTLFHDFTTAVREKLIPDVEAFVRDQYELMGERHTRVGESLYLLQPNVKEGAGGLRDYHTAYWVARAAQPLVNELGDFLHVGLLTESEMATYRAGLQFLWRVRNALHLLPGRTSDQMSFENQEILAEQFGYSAEGNGAELPVERFMQEYYLHARAVKTFSEIVIEQCLARARGPQEPPATTEVEDGFRVAPDHLEVPHAAHLRERPLRLLTAFAVAQDHDVPLSRTARRLVREQLGLIDEAFQSDPEAAATFLRILGAKERVMRTLMAMNEVGVLGRYLPEWEHVVCRWQHVVYHTYTVDVHSIFLVEELRRLWRGEYKGTVPRLSELVHEVPDLPALYLGCLLHDIGKGLGGDHSSKGAVLTRTCLERLGIEEERIKRVVFVVQAHLLMSHISQRRDLGDPKVIVEFARLVGDRENLHNLYLATFADMRASSKSAWSEWRAGLLDELFDRTSEFLESGRDDPARALEQLEARIETRIAGARKELAGLGVAESRIDAFFQMMPRRYYVSHSPRQIARHALVVFSLKGDQLMATAVREMRAGFSEFLICTRDVHGLYSRVAGCLTAAGINILGSHVYSSRTGLALEVYRVTTPVGGENEREESWNTLRAVLGRVLSGEEDVHELLRRRGRRVGASRTPSRRPASISIRNDISDFYTVVDVTANDRLGLLCDLTRVITDHGLEIYLSKASTVLDQVADTFYLKTNDLKKLTDPAKTKALRVALAEVVEDDGDG